MTKPLDGVLVVALEQALAAPYATCRMADAGARVIKIERAVGDFARGYDTAVFGEASYFVWVNRGKESLVVNLKDEDDAALLWRIVAKADVFVQNFAPGATERLGFGSEALREQFPRLITCDISGYGDGAYREMKAYDFLVQSESGLVSISGAVEGMGRIGVSICDIGAGMNAYSAVLQALFLRERTGKGSGVQVSLFDTAADWMTVPLMQHEYGGKAPRRVGMSHPSIAPYGGYLCNDGEMVVIAVQNEREWGRFCEGVLERPFMATDERFATNSLRVENRLAMNSVIEAVFAQHSRPQMQAKLREAAIAYGSVNSLADLSQHPQLRRVPMWVNGELAQMVASPLITANDDAEFAAIPQIGEHSAKIRAEFGV
ncbi:MAG: CaiB/BaiF CoA-transferase family protein [Chloroflexota bacterium]